MVWEVGDMIEVVDSVSVWFFVTFFLLLIFALSISV
jgi:hypothetical protein